MTDSKDSSDATSGSEPDVDLVKSSSSKTGKTTKRRFGNPFTRLARFVREVVAELRKVIYPNRNELIRYTVVVVFFVAVMVSIVAGLEWGFTTAVNKVFGGSSE